MPRLAAALLVTLVALLLCPAAPAAEPPARLSAAEQRGGWKLLFDGRTTKGWRNYKSQQINEGWTVRDGALTRSKAGAGDIVSEEQFADFELSLEYRISPQGNSGIMFHVREDQPRPWHSGPEVQIQDNAKGHDPQKSGWLYQLYKPVKPEWAKRFEKQVGFETPEVADATRPAGQWNHVYLRVTRGQSEVAINGVSYYYFHKGDDEWNRRVAKSKFSRYPQFGKATSGHLCLQDHGNEVAFRNIKIRTLKEDGTAPNPVDGTLPVKAVEAFPKLTWEGWEGVDERGRVKNQRPLILTHAGDNSNRIFVASQIGMVHVFANDPAVSKSKMFLDLRKKTHDWAKDDEEGLLGLAFHPQYKKNGQFFVYYSPEAEPRVAYVSRFRVSKDDPDRADPASEEVVLRIEQPFSNHNGGSIVFGKDGYLYIALGDGGGRNDPIEHGQALSSWMGCVLRIDVDHSDGDQPYRVPKDNPFVGRENARPEIYAYGFRNVWRLSVDRETGALWCGDVGQDLWEEVNIVQRGGNYGWSVREGTYGFGNSEKSGADPKVDPVWEYDHRVGKSITGGLVYRGKRVPELAGAYLYADYVSGRIWALKYDQQKRQVIGNWAIRSNGLPVFSFGEDEQGEVYYTISAPTGRTIFRFEQESP